ncbi:Adenosylcobinamide amidohydrolase [Sporomusa ovata DSM 2662]|uniref:Adenosylcobinamide amidohydrolase n=1 Tax=Sporomusa ovata TaxID=2378 RepID=A0A0U1L404_9FIRM|nr:adenosylcobinamide amidohydrolase [Sporomusa ovata]EQB25844.1 adenosylcobinamide amidohydrolase CbiZ [Sporomusa ovata DSM 2662]CQR74408.1 Adenosylcobinamide amidohydrolase [Sporomusa ovata]
MKKWLQGLLVVIILWSGAIPCLGSEQIPVSTLSTGDKVYRQGTSLIVAFHAPRDVLSTSVINGGIRHDLKAVFNHDMKGAIGVTGANYPQYMQQVAGQLGLNPGKVTSMGTAASMENAVIQSESYQSLTVTAIATGGVEGNGGRVGDPASYFTPGKKPASYKAGTINIMLVIDADLPAGTMARALVTCTEAKTAALQELVAGSRFSTGLATGSGTDQTIVITNPGSPLYLEDAGKHAKLGELIGRTVKQAVKDTLLRQSGLSPQKQHSVLRRMNRFGVTEDSLYQQYQQEYGTVDKQHFLASLRQVDKEPALVTSTSLYVHLLDQNQWQLLSADELAKAGNDLLLLTAGKYQVLSPAVATGELAADVRAWSALVVKIVENQISQMHGSEALPPAVSPQDRQHSADQFTESMLTGINRSDYTSFSANFDQKMKSSLPESQFRLLSQSIKQKLGNYVSKELVTAEPKETFTIFTYKVKFEKEKAAVTVRTVLTQEDARILVAGFWMDAPM